MQTGSLNCFSWRGGAFTLWMSHQHFWYAGFTRMDCRKHHFQAMESSLNLTFFIVYFSCSWFWMCSPLHFSFRQMRRCHFTTGPWQPCYNITWMVIGRARMQTLLHSRMSVTARYIVSLIFIHFIWYSNEELLTLHCNLQCLLEKSLPLSKNGWDSKLHYSTHCIMLALAYSAPKNATNEILTGVFAGFVKSKRLANIFLMYWMVLLKHQS